MGALVPGGDTMALGRMEDWKPTQDWERAMIFLFVLKMDMAEEHPEWGEKEQTKMLADIAGWTPERAKKALLETVQKGYSNQAATGVDPRRN